MDTRPIWVPAPGWGNIDSDMTCEEKKPLDLAHFQAFQSPAYPNPVAWPDMASSYSESAPSGLPWYTSPVDSEGAQASDFSPCSGYFDWSQSSNNTSPNQYDEVVHYPSPAALPGPSRLVRPNRPSRFVPSYPNARRSSCQDAPSTHNRPQLLEVVSNYPRMENFALSAEQEVAAVVTSPVSSEPLAEPSSEPNARVPIENGDSANPRNGKRWKAAHRAVERRYRSNLNLKIVKLGQCIPAIRSQAIGIEDLESAEDCRTAPKAKIQKGHVLSKAVDYIQSLQLIISQLEAEKRQLEDKVEELHKIMHGESRPPAATAQFDRTPALPKPIQEPGHLAEGRPRTALAIPLKEDGINSIHFKAENPSSPHQTGFGFGPDDSTFTSNRSRVTKAVDPWHSST